MKVNHINGTSESSCKCGTWLDHWKNFSHQSLPEYCPVVGCKEKPGLGAHVLKDNSTDRNWYIVPLCSKHNGEKGKSFDLTTNIALVLANVSITCGK